MATIQLQIPANPPANNVRHTLKSDRLKQKKCKLQYHLKLNNANIQFSKYTCIYIPPQTIHLIHFIFYKFLVRLYIFQQNKPLFNYFNFSMFMFCYHRFSGTNSVHLENLT